MHIFHGESNPDLYLPRCSSEASSTSASWTPSPPATLTTARFFCFRSCFLRSEFVGQWQDLFKGNLTLLLVLISCEDLLLRRSTKRAPMSSGWPSSWAKMAVQVKIIWSRSISPWNTCIWLVWRRWGWFGAVQRCYWRSWGERFEEQATEEERGSRWRLRMWRKIFACFNKNRRELLSFCKLCLDQIIFLRVSSWQAFCAEDFCIHMYVW